MKTRTVLMDTQIALWMIFDDPKLPSAVRQHDGRVQWMFHQLSLVEIQLKYNLGKLKLPEAPASFLPRMIAASRFQYVALQDEAIYFLAKLPSIHRDPFDRLLVAHALVNGWELATTDKVLQTYPVKIFG